MSIKPLPKSDEQLPKVAAKVKVPYVEYFDDGKFFEAPHDDDED